MIYGPGNLLAKYTDAYASEKVLAYTDFLHR